MGNDKNGKNLKEQAELRIILSMPVLQRMHRLNRSLIM